MALPVRMYTTNFCVHCVRAKLLLQKRGIAFEEIFVDRSDDEKRRWLISQTGGYRTFPSIFIGEKFIGGSRELHELDKNGTLKELVNLL